MALNAVNDRHKFNYAHAPAAAPLAYLAYSGVNLLRQELLEIILQTNRMEGHTHTRTE
jgi:hypothetical protein